MKVEVVQNYNSFYNGSLTSDEDLEEDNDNKDINEMITSQLFFIK